MPKTDQDRARIRAYHRDRAIVNKISKEGSALAVDRMTEAALWRLMETYAHTLWLRMADGRDVDGARLARDLGAVADELFRRGHQLNLPI